MSERLTQTSTGAERFKPYVIYSREQEGKLDVPFVGFTREQEKKVKKQIAAVGLPTDNITEVNYAPSKRGEENMLGSYAPYDGRLSLYKSLEKLPAIAQNSTISHELAHANSPFNEKNTHLFGSVENQESVKQHVIGVVKQSLESKKYLNGYQAFLAKQMEEAASDPKALEAAQMRFVEETHAILVELRLNNPKHLDQVEAAQRQTLKKAKGSNSSVVPLRAGVDKTLTMLMPDVDQPRDIDKVARRTRGIFGPKRILPNIAA